MTPAHDPAEIERLAKRLNTYAGFLPLCFASEAKVMRKAAAALLAEKRRADEASADTQRLDWLERKSVKVDLLLRYGTRAVFTCAPDLEDEKSDLRHCIDAALAAAGKEGA